MKVKHLAVATVAMGALSLAAQAASIGVQFNGNNTPLASTDVAGVTAVAQDKWNVLTGASWTNQALTDNAGATAATLTGSASGGYFSGALTDTAGNIKLTSGEIYSSWSGFSQPGHSILTFSNITYSQYDIYVYATTDTYGRNETIAVTPQGGSTLFQSFTIMGGGSTWVLANNPVEGWNGTGTQPTSAEAPFANYVRFTGVSGSSFTMDWGAPGNGALNGVQIVAAVPEPVSAGLLGLGALGLLKRRRA